jgi:ABC-type nitrate/sulfonate/bicarbonate transport system ATPase subunit
MEKSSTFKKQQQGLAHQQKHVLLNWKTFAENASIKLRAAVDEKKVFIFRKKKKGEVLGC